MGGRENKKKPHDYSWHPEFGWQLLRRTPSYRNAVEVFLDEAKNANDNSALALYHSLSKSDFYSIKSNTQTVLGEKRDQKLRQNILEQTHFSFFPDYNFQKNHPLFENHKSDSQLLRHEKQSRGLGFNQDSKHYRRFYSWYGDIIRFPVSPYLLHIDEAVLNSVWSFRPFMIVDKDLFNSNSRNTTYSWHTGGIGYLDRKNNSKCSYHIIKINNNFSPERIRNEVGDYFYKMAMNEEYLTNKMPWDQEDFDLRIKIIDELEKAKAEGRKLGSTKLAQKYFSHLKQSEIAKKKKMEKIIKYTQNTMLKIFDRPMPKISKSKFA